MTKFILVIAALLLLNSCRIEGCMDPEATVEGACRYFEYHGINMAPCDLTDLSFDKAEETTENGRPVLLLSNNSNTDYMKLFFVERIESGNYEIVIPNYLFSQWEICAEYQTGTAKYLADGWGDFYVDYGTSDVYVSYCSNQFDKTSGTGESVIDTLYRIHAKR